MQTVQKLGERRQWFPLNRFCIQKLIKNKLAGKPDDTKHRVVKKVQGQCSKLPVAYSPLATNFSRWRPPTCDLVAKKKKKKKKMKNRAVANLS